MTRSYKAIIGFFRFLVRFFFRRVTVTGLEHIPRDRGGVIISWHPNGLIDPGLILTHFPGRVVFGARNGLFKWPVLGRLMRAIGTVPIFRATDNRKKSDDARREANAKSIDALAQAVADGSFSALFPEGVSHDDPHLRTLKKGGARLYYRARQLQKEGKPAPAILPVGLHYDAKAAFRSNVLIAFHPPIELPESLDVTPADDEPYEVLNDRAGALTETFDHVLEDVVHATDSWDLHHILHRTRSLLHAERERRRETSPKPAKMEQRVSLFARVREVYYDKVVAEPDRIEALKQRVMAYDADLQQLDMEDHELDGNPPLVGNWLRILLLAQLFAAHILLPPLVILGLLINAPAIALLLAAARSFTKLQKDKATIKLLAAAVLFPVSWVTASVLTTWGYINLHEAYPTIPDIPLVSATVAFIIGVLGGATALGYRKFVREIWHTARVRITRNRHWFTIQRLLYERADLHDELVKLVDAGDVGDGV